MPFISPVTTPPRAFRVLTRRPSARCLISVFRSITIPLRSQTFRNGLRGLKGVYLMSRLSASVLVVLFCCCVVDAAEPHQDWMRFLKGEWTYEYASLGLKGEVKYNMAAKRHAIVARGKEGDDMWVELIGWRPDTKTMVFTGYAAKNGNYWHSDCEDVTNDKVSGSTSGILPDGRRFKGTVTLNRVNDDRFDVHLNGKAGGEEMVDVGEFTRKPE